MQEVFDVLTLCIIEEHHIDSENAILSFCDRYTIEELLPVGLNAVYSPNSSV